MRYLTREESGKLVEIKFTDGMKSDLYFKVKDGACFEQTQLEHGKLEILCLSC